MTAATLWLAALVAMGLVMYKDRSPRLVDSPELTEWGSRYSRRQSNGIAGP